MGLLKRIGKWLKPSIKETPDSTDPIPFEWWGDPEEIVFSIPDELSEAAKEQARRVGLERYIEEN